MNIHDEFLDFESAHESATSTILLVHRAAASSLDWDLVQPHLSSYHLLMPSLFTQHSVQLARKLATSTPPTTDSTSTSNQPTWQPAYLHLLADLVKTKARNSQAHIVGLSMGASVALAFATTHPSLTLSVFASGLPAVKQRPSPFAYSLLHAGLLGANKLQNMISPATAQRLLDGEVALHPGGWDGNGQRVTSELTWIVMDVVREFTPVPIDIPRVNSGLDGVRPGPLRVFVLAATRTKWWMPVGDSVDWAVEVAKLLCGVNNDDAGDNKSQDDGSSVCLLQVKALEAKRMFHPWNRQAPEVFAQCILAAAEGIPLPALDVTEMWSHSTYR